MRAAEANGPPLVRAGLSWALRQRKSPSGHIGFPKRSLWVFLGRAECPSVLFQPFKFIGSHLLSGLRCFCITAVTEEPLSSSNPLGPKAGVPSAPPRPRLSPRAGELRPGFQPRNHEKRTLKVSVFPTRVIFDVIITCFLEKKKKKS